MPGASCDCVLNKFDSGIYVPTPPLPGLPRNPHWPTPPVQGCGMDVSVQGFLFSFQRDRLIWSFLPGTPLPACFCIFWNLNLQASVGPSAPRRLTPTAELGSRLASPPARSRSAGWGLCVWVQGSLELPHLQRLRAGLAGRGWVVRPLLLEETVDDDFNSGTRPGPKFPLAPSQQRDLSQPLPPDSPGFSAVLPAPRVAVTVRRNH